MKRVQQIEASAVESAFKAYFCETQKIELKRSRINICLIKSSLDFLKAAKEAQDISETTDDEISDQEAKEIIAD